MEFSKERKCRAITLSVMNENDKINKELTFFKEVSMGGPARYVDRIDPICYDNNFDMTSEAIWHPTCINLELWFREVIDYAIYQLSPRVHKNTDNMYEHRFIGCINNMIYKTQNSCLPITNISEMIISRPIQILIGGNHCGLRSAMMDLTGLFNGVKVVYASPDEYLKSQRQ